MRDAHANRRLIDWFSQWRSPLRKFLIRRNARSRADVDDISQEVFLRLLRYNQAELVHNAFQTAKPGVKIELHPTDQGPDFFLLRSQRRYSLRA